jgi:8-oxo-dGTP pyrophosphatase MutT (NUDIX family)
MIGRIRTLVRNHPDCFERTCLPGHITGSAWIVSEDRQRHLLTHHRKLNRWLQPGGHADGDPEPHRVALREAQEESGLSDFTFIETNGMLLPLDVDVHLIPSRTSDPEHEHHDLRYLLIASGNQSVRVSDESHDVRWFTRDGLLAVTEEESVLRMLRKALDRI